MAPETPEQTPKIPEWTWQAKVHRIVARGQVVCRWANRDWLHRGITALAVSAILAVGALWHWTSYARHETQRGPDLAQALAALNAGRYDEARNIANQLREAPGLNYQEHSGPLFVLGTVLAHDAAEQWNDERRKTLYLLAARYLQEARERELDAELDVDAVFLLGQCLYLAASYGEATPVLQEALLVNPDRATRIHLLLANCFYHAATPDLDQALLHARKFVGVPDTEPTQRAQTWLQISSLEVRKQDYAAAREALSHIPPDSNLVPLKTLHRIRLDVLDLGQAALQDSDGQITKYLNGYQKAIDELRVLMAKHPPGSEVVRGAHYLIGVCYRQRADLLASAELKVEATLEYEKALNQFFRTQKLFYRYAEGIVAALEEPELDQRLGRYDDAAVAYDRLVVDLRGFEPYDNPWLSEKELIDRLKAAHARFVAADQFAAAVRFADQMNSVLPHVEAALLLATSLEGWAEYLESQSKAEPWSNAEETLGRSREKWRETAVAYRRLAELRFATREYPEDLWSSAHAFLRGRNYRQAVKAIQKYLATESRPQRARGLLGLGEAYLALGDADAAYKSLNDIVRFYESHPLSYRARILASRASALKGDWDAAEASLKANIEHEDLTPQSIEWRDSLFALGSLLFQRGLHEDAASRVHGQRPANPDLGRKRFEHLEQANALFSQAAERLEESINRYGDTPDAIVARYQLAESLRKGSRYLLERLASETIEADRAVWRRQIRRQLEAAILQYRELQDLLNVKQEEQTLSVTESAILRNSYYSHADALFDLAEYEDAIKAFSSVSNRYQNEPIALEAFVQIASCYHRLGRLGDARGTIEQARVVLSRISPDADFLATTRYDREDWTKLLDWLAQL